MENATDHYLTSLVTEGVDIRDGDKAVVDMESRLREMKERQQSRRQLFEPSARHYLLYLQSQGRDSPELRAFLAPDSTAIGGPPSKVPRIRVGEKRKAVLEAFAQFTSEGRSATTREIANASGLGAPLIGNVTVEDRGRGHLQRSGAGHVMTEQGYEFLRQVGSPKGDLKPAETKPPTDLLDQSAS